MSAGHTPGPWSFDGPAHNLIVWSDSENRVCFLAHSDGANDERDFANARLIAAAPELLEALQSILREATIANDVIRLGRDDEGSGRVKVATAMHRIAELAKPAIAKATGAA